VTPDPQQNPESPEHTSMGEQSTASATRERACRCNDERCGCACTRCVPRQTPPGHRVPVTILPPGQKQVVDTCKQNSLLQGLGIGVCTSPHYLPSGTTLPLSGCPPANA